MIFEKTRPLVLVGDTRSRTNVAILQQLKWGRMVVEKSPKPYPCEPWGFDNMAFIAWRSGAVWDADSYLRRLDVAQSAPNDPCMAIVPDVVAAGLHSLDFSLKWRTTHLRGVDWPWYLAVQDGMEVSDVAPHMHLFAGLFLGGSDRFKATA